MGAAQAYSKSELVDSALVTMVNGALPHGPCEMWSDIRNVRACMYVLQISRWLLEQAKIASKGLQQELAFVLVMQAVSV